MRAYAGGANSQIGELALKILEYRNVRKCRATYVDAIKIHPDGRVRPSWASTGTVSGRWSARDPNLANLPKKQNDAAKALGGIRSLYIAPEGRKLVAFDLKQAEFRIAAYYSGDKNMIAVCESGGDIHWMNACRIFSLPPTTVYDPNNPKLKELRDLAKNAVFAVVYMAEAGTVHSNIIGFGGKATLQQVEAMLASMRVSFKDYYEFQAEIFNKVIRSGYVESPILGRKRWLGHDPKTPETANFPVQSGAADVMNHKCWEILETLSHNGLDAKPVACVYDALYLDTLDEHVHATEEVIDDAWEKPIVIGRREMIMPIDRHTASRWSEL
jgi:DNA polymerase I - 3''-5'' exonuclease and polymerase domains